MDVSVVVPLLNEEGNVSDLVVEVCNELEGADVLFELVLVDDGSCDRTWSEVTACANNFSSVVGIKLSRNFGHQNALLAGLSYAKGRAVISMDGDLQHPPKILPELIKLWRGGKKIVHTRRCNYEKLGFFKKNFSKWFYKIFSWLSGVSVEEGSSDYRLIDIQVLEEIKSFNDVNPFLRGAVKWVGFEEDSATVDYSVETRVSGESSYTFRRMLKFANNAIVSFSVKPLLLGIWLGIVTSFLAFLELGYIVWIYIAGVAVPGWASTVGIVALLFGILFILLGVIGLYLSRIHIALQDRPKFIVNKVVSMVPRGSL